MHKVILAAVFLCGIFSCSSQRNQTNAPSSRDTVPVLVKDSIEFYETDYETRQKNYRELLIGEWTIDTMRRQARLPGEALTDVYLSFTDSAFTGNAGCNRIRGIYTLKGTSIKFSNVISTKMACDRLEQENAFLNLLQNSVSAYTVTQNTLWLRDGSSNIIFQARKR